MKRTNWAGNYTYEAATLDTPNTVADVQSLLSSQHHAKALGTCHSFNDIANSSGSQVSLTHLNGMSLDREAQTVTVGAGVRYGELAPWLDAQGFAVHNLASLPHISVVGACATGTHGSGIHNGCLSTAVAALKFVDGTGALQALSRSQNPEEFNGSVVALGALGIVTEITLDAMPTFHIAQTVYENLSFDQLEDNLDAIFSSAYSVSLFTEWQHHRATQVWLKQTVKSEVSTPTPLFYGAMLQKAKLHPLAGHPAENCTEQMGIAGVWYERLPHFRMNFTPSSGAELQSEYFVPRAQAYEALLAIESLKELITPLLFVSELRTVAADDLWLSPAYQRDCLGFHFTWKPEEDAVRGILPLIEAKLAPFQARPHWAKLFTMPGERVRSLYPRLDDFLRLTRQFDPQQKFANSYLQRALETA